MSLSAAISDVGYTYRDIPDLYRQTEHQIQFRYQTGNQAIINTNVLLEPHAIQLAYAKDLKDSIITALLGIKRENFQELFTEFSTALQAGETLEIKMMLVDLITSLKAALDKKELIFADETWDFNVFVDELLQEDSLTDTLHSIQSYFGRIMDTLDEQQKLKYEVLTQQIKEFIQQHYAEEFFSINNVADYANLSTNYVGRLFKKYHGTSIADYIMEVRLTNAIRLMSESDFSVNEIARQVGFSNNSYFYNVFKKTYGMTPNQYRQQL